MSINSVNLTGRLTRDPEIRYTDSGTSIARFSLAVDRRFKTDSSQNADFPNCIAWGKTAEFVEKYFRKGMKLELTGRLQTGSYTNKDGIKVYTTDVVAEQVGFGESKSFIQEHTQSTEYDSGSEALGDGFVNVPEGIDEELPFN